eukprot:jgi/Mesvir1/23045/Mv08162-RA.3
MASAVAVHQTLAASSIRLGKPVFQPRATSVRSRPVIHGSARFRRSGVVATASVEAGPSANADGDYVVPEVAALEDAGDTQGVEAKGSSRKAGPLARGGTAKGTEALGKDPGAAARQGSLAASSGRFEDPRWIKAAGTWDFEKFKLDNGETDWDSVIDAGRAAMIGFAWAMLWEKVSGQSLVSQFDSFGGKFFLILTLIGIMLVRKQEDLKELQNLTKELNYYDKQWEATWEGKEKPE